MGIAWIESWDLGLDNWGLLEYRFARATGSSMARH